MGNYSISTLNMNWKNRYIFGTIFMAIFVALNHAILFLYLFLLPIIFPSIKNLGNLELAGVFFLIPEFLFSLILGIIIWRIAIKKFIGLDRFGEYTGSFFFLLFISFVIYMLAIPISA